MKKLILNIVLFFACTAGWSQSGISISFGHTGVQLTDTVMMGDTISVNCWIVNTGNDILSGHIHINAALYDSTLGQINDRVIGGQGPVFIYPGDSIPFSQNMLYEVVATQYYNGGGNIVVIWPRLADPVTQNNQHIYNDVFVNGYSPFTGISNVQALTTPICFPQPAKNSLTFNQEKKISKINIYNVLAEKILSKSVLNNSCNISELKSGIYILEMYV